MKTSNARKRTCDKPAASSTSHRRAIRTAHVYMNALAKQVNATGPGQASALCPLTVVTSRAACTPPFQASEWTVWEAQPCSDDHLRDGLCSQGTSTRLARQRCCVSTGNTLLHCIVFHLNGGDGRTLQAKILDCEAPARACASQRAIVILWTTNRGTLALRSRGTLGQHPLLDHRLRTNPLSIWGTRTYQTQRSVPQIFAGEPIGPGSQHLVKPCRPIE
ncbi:hypothetical protein PYCCODRAFT_181732 [Trametes coccinea BRFM310]|uniref:Uncharacterized protein n=1 Tax=Trametes coccinea (strain BRFM310) TaxID=1353009 RepID=A0A1Y2IVB6_TRAC3|nr:hypothetical protein PYCCODRAFT_181732 [Trametes coccinea BRFM310]